MKNLILILVFALILPFAAVGCSGGKSSAIPTEKIEGSWLYVKKVENLPDDFMLGMDISSVLSEEESGVKYYGFDGKEQDVFRTLAENGVNTIRVRVWNDPYDEEGRGFGGGNCDIDRAVEIGKRAAAVGMKLLVDFHLSDFWADPGKQMVPRAWKDMDIETKANACYDYVKACCEKLKKAGVGVSTVQIGNETNGSLCGEKIWFNIAQLMSAGSRAVREVLPDALVALHFANPEKEGAYANYASKLAYYNIDYDMFASSYYPYWHGSLENLAAVLNEIAETYGKKVMVMETSYAYTAADSDFSGNTIGDGGAFAKPYPFTIQGQANQFRDVVDTVANGMKNGIGVIYWEGAWITVGHESYEENSVLWEKHGSGWASSFAAVYDPNDAGKYYGGSAVDNQAMFDPYGNPLESLRVFNLVRYGNDAELRADAVEDVTLFVDLNGKIELPDTVNAVMNDNSLSPVHVTWTVTESRLAEMYAGGVNTYEISGNAEGLPAHCYINMVEYNFLENYSFESGELEPWRVIERGSADELYVEKKPTDSLTGDWHMHFWSAASGSVDFSLEQDVTGLAEGTYKFAVSIMGGDAGDTEIYAYVLVDGVEVGRAPMEITSYNEWHMGLVPDFAVAEGQTVTVGIFVRCSGAGSGAWGKIDDAMLNSVG